MSIIKDPKKIPIQHEDTLITISSIKDTFHGNTFRSWFRRIRGSINTYGVSSNPTLKKKEGNNHGRKNTGNQSSASFSNAQCANRNVSSHYKMFVDSQVGQKIIYASLYVLTSWAMIAAYHFPHSSVQQPIFFMLALALTILSSLVTIKMLIFLAVAPWHTLLSTLRAKKYDDAYNPFVSVIIPAYHEEKGIVATIKTILASTYRNIEIIIINDGSTLDNSDTAIKNFIKKYYAAMVGATNVVPIIYDYQANAGKAAALNNGIKRSHGEIIICIDADCAMDRDCIRAFVQVLQDDTIQAACGNVKVGNMNSVLSTVQLFEYAASFYARQTDSLLGTLYVISGAAGAYRREVFDNIGLYGTRLRGGGEDVDMSIRVQQAGLKIAYAANAVVYTEVPTLIKYLMKQRKRWTFSRFMAFKRYRSMIFSRKKEHNKILTWIVIPLIIFNDTFYTVKMVLKIGLYLFAIVTGSYQVLAVLILLSMVITAIPLLQDRQYRQYILLTPLSWLLSFYLGYVEVVASVTSVYKILRGQEVTTWGKQQRQGVITIKRH